MKTINIFTACAAILLAGISGVNASLRGLREYADPWDTCARLSTSNCKSCCKSVESSTKSIQQCQKYAGCPRTADVKPKPNPWEHPWDTCARKSTDSCKNCCKKVEGSTSKIRECQAYAGCPRTADVDPWNNWDTCRRQTSASKCKSCCKSVGGSTGEIRECQKYAGCPRSADVDFYGHYSH